MVTGRVIGVCGVMPIYGVDTGEAFAIFKGRASEHPGAMLSMRLHFPEICRPWHRVQALVNLYAPESIRFSQWIGMRPEAVIYESGPNKETFVMYVTVRGIDR